MVGARKYWWVLLLGVNLVIAVLVALVIRTAQTTSTHPVLMGIPASPTPSATPSPTPPAFADIYNTKIHVSTDHWYSWALIDTKSGILVGSENWAEPSYVMSMIKPWIAADYFNQHPKPDSWTLSRLTSMIVDSNDEVAYDYFAGKPSLDRLVATCGLTDLVERGWSWSLTSISARDTARMGHCIYTGHATSSEWTSWIVDKMKHVRGEGDFGPRSLFPDRTQLATKNGWYNWEGKWYINCLTISDSWTLSTLQNWPYDGKSFKSGITQAEAVCNSVASQVLRLS